METYSDKLRDPRWQKKRLEIFQRDNWACRMCGDSETELIVHHKEYQKGLEPWEYDDFVLVTLCVNCHEKGHNLLDGFHVSKVAGVVIDTLEEAQGRDLDRGIPIVGLPTGFDRLDWIMSGLQGGDLVVVASRPSMGKTDFALNIVRNVAVRSNIPVVLFSLGSPSREVTLRLLAATTNINSAKIRQGYWSLEDWERFCGAASNLDDAPFYIDDGHHQTVKTISRRIRNLQREKGLKLALVDNLDLLVPNKFEIPIAATNFKKLAMELDIPIAVLSSLDRRLEARVDKHPVLGDIVSGELVDISDTIVFLYRDDYYNKEENNPNKGKVETIIAKHRNGPVAVAELKHDISCGRFEDIVFLIVPVRGDRQGVCCLSITKGGKQGAQAVAPTLKKSNNGIAKTEV